MKSETRVYIARKYAVKDSIYVAAAYLEEGVFASYDLAYEFITEYCEADEWDDALGKIVCFEIVSLLMNDNQPWEREQTWTFDKAGKLLDFYEAQRQHENCQVVDIGDGIKEIYREPEPGAYTGKFKVGDLVFVRARPWNKESGSAIDVIGVISGTPVPYEEYLAESGDFYGWDDAYVVSCVESGYLDHIHVREAGIVLYTEELPEYLSFLKRLSDHLTGKGKIRDEVLTEILQGKIFVGNVRHLTEEDLA